MKKLIAGFVLTFLSLLMSVSVYGKTSSDFTDSMYSDGKLYSFEDFYLSSVADVNIPPEYQQFCVTDDYIYLIKEADENQTANNIYRSDKDLKNIEFFASLPDSTSSFMYYDNNIFYENCIYTPDYINNYTEILSINTDTKKVTKHLTYCSDSFIFIEDISNDYMIFSIGTEKVYKQNIYDPLDKKLILQTGQDMNCFFAGEKNLYLKLAKDNELYAIDIASGKIANKYELEMYYDPICNYNDSLYIFNDDRIDKYSSDGKLEEIPLPEDIDTDNMIHTEYLYEGNINVVEHMSAENKTITSIYSIDENKWSEPIETEELGF